MVMLIAQPDVEETLKAERRASGTDRWDEVWDGVYFMSPLPNIEHQYLVGMISAIFQIVLNEGKLGTAYPGVNVSDLEDDWTHNYRCPDIAVVMQGNPA